MKKLFFIIADDNGSQKKIVFKKWEIYIFFGILGLVLAFGLYALFVSWNFSNKLILLNQLKLTNAKLSRQLVFYESKIKKINKRLENIDTLTQKLTLISHLNDPNRHPSGVVESLNSMLDDFKKFYLGDDSEIELKLRELKKSIVKAEAKSSLLEEKVSILSDYLMAQSSLLASTPAILPVHGWFTSGFGYRIDPFTHRLRRHDGIDIAARVGTPIIAPADGIVTFAGRKVGYGITLVIDHGFGITTRYGHCSKLLVVHGEKVRRGMPIALVGNTGRSTGPHLHYEVRINGVPVNPLRFILDKF